MTSQELDALIFKAQSGGILTAQEQASLAGELVVYRAMALRLERCVHELDKEAEAAHD